MDAQVPFSWRKRSLVVEPLPDGYGFAFNYAAPAGVKLLHPSLYSRLVGRLDRANPVGDAGILEEFPAILNNPREKVADKRLTVWLHVVNGCNFSCHYCYIPHLDRAVDRHLIEARSLPRAKVRPLIDNLLAYCGQNGLEKLHVVFAGGEPTLNLPLVADFCREARSDNRGVRVTFGMISNGSFEANQLFPLLSEYEIRLSLSVDGLQEKHDAIRFSGTASDRIGSWQTLVQNVAFLRRREVPLYFLYTATPENVTDLSGFARFAHANGIGFRVSLVRRRKPTASHIQREMAEVLSSFYDELGESLDSSLPVHRFAAFAEWDLYRVKYAPCSSCRNYFAISTSGGVASCQMRLDAAQGDASQESFRHLASRVQLAAASGFLAHPEQRQGACSRCEYYLVCAGGCPQHTAIAFGEMDRPSPWCHVYGTVFPHYIRAVARQLQRRVTANTAMPCGSF
jgi:radical SAM protein with 4Fe4S-binding SPASM domain